MMVIMIACRTMPLLDVCHYSVSRSPNATVDVLLLILIKVEHVQEIKAAHAHSNEIVSIALYSSTLSTITILQRGLNQSPRLSDLSFLFSLVFSSNWFSLSRSQIFHFFFVLSQSHFFFPLSTCPVHSLYPLPVFGFRSSGGCPRPGLFQGRLNCALCYTDFFRWLVYIIYERFAHVRLNS